MMYSLYTTKTSNHDKLCSKRTRAAPCSWLDSDCTGLKVGAWQVGPRLAGPRVGTSLAGDPGVTPREERPPVNGVETAGELLGSPPSASICKWTVHSGISCSRVKKHLGIASNTTAHFLLTFFACTTVATYRFLAMTNITCHFAKLHNRPRMIPDYVKHKWLSIVK